MALEQLIKEYSAQGWKLTQGEEIGERKVDLIARKGKEVIVFEIKSERYSGKEKDKAASLAREAREKGYEFRLVIVNPPKERSVEVIGLELLFYQYFIENFPGELDALSSSTTLNDVYDCDVDDITVNEGTNIEVKGVGTIEVMLQYGPSSDGDSSSMSFPFSFEVLLRIEEGKLTIEEVMTLSVDTSSFYE